MDAIKKLILLAAMWVYNTTKSLFTVKKWYVVYCDCSHGDLMSFIKLWVKKFLNWSWRLDFLVSIRKWRWIQSLDGHGHYPSARKKIKINQATWFKEKTVRIIGINPKSISTALSSYHSNISIPHGNCFRLQTLTRRTWNCSEAEKPGSGVAQPSSWSRHDNTSLRNQSKNADSHGLHCSTEEVTCSLANCWSRLV